MANAIAQRDGGLRYVDVDASGRSRARDGDRADPAGAASRSPGSTRPRSTASPAKTGPAIERLTLQGGTREWNVDMRSASRTRTSPTSTAAACGCPASRTPSRSAPGRTRCCARRTSSASWPRRARRARRCVSLDVRPDRVSLELDADGRTLALDYGYDAQLTSRDIRATTGVPVKPVDLDTIDPRGDRADGPHRPPRRRSKGLADVQYVLLSLDPRGLLAVPRAGVATRPTWSPNLRGRRLTWPGRG